MIPLSAVSLNARVWRSAVISTFFCWTAFSPQPYSVILAGTAQVSCLWVGLQPITLLELSRWIQRELVPKWTRPSKLIMNWAFPCIIARYPICSCRWPRKWVHWRSWPLNSSQLWITYVSLNRFSKAKAREKLAVVDLEMELWSFHF